MRELNTLDETMKAFQLSMFKKYFQKYEGVMKATEHDTKHKLLR